jgi:hypothetical protein
LVLVRDKVTPLEKVGQFDELPHIVFLAEIEVQCPDPICPLEIIDGNHFP